MYTVYASTPPTMSMIAVGFGWPDLRAYAEKCLAVLPLAGPPALDLMEQGWKLWQGVSGRDLGAILSAFAAAQRDIDAIIAAIKTEFSL